MQDPRIAMTIPNRLNLHSDFLYRGGFPMGNLRIAIFLALFAVSSQAPAQLVPEPEPDRALKLKASGSFTHDSNLFRLSDAVDAQTIIGTSDKSDNIYSLGAGGSYELQASRQKFLLEANVNDHKYQQFDQLDYVGYDARGEWKWQVGNFWDGTLGAGHRRYLGGFANVQSDIKDLIDQDRVYASANYHLNSHVRLTLDLSQYDSRHGADSQKPYNNKTDNAAFTVNWVTPAENTVGLQYRNSRASFPNRQTVAGNQVDNAYREDELNVVSTWRISGISNFQARIGYTQRNYGESSSRDFSGTTWRLTYNWQPTGKLAFDLSTWREIAEFQNVNANYVQLTGVSFGPTWSLTSKIAVQGKVTYQSDKYLGDPGNVPGLQARSDTERIYQIALLWTPVRRTTLDLSLERGERTSNQAIFSYDYSTLMATVAYAF